MPPPICLRLRHFGAVANEYEVVFTRSATGALALLADLFDFGPRGGQQGDFYAAGAPVPPGDDRPLFAYLGDNHTSVVGIREVAINAGASVVVVAEEDVCPVTNKGDKFLPLPRGGVQSSNSDDITRCLFAYPAQVCLCPHERVRGVRVHHARKRWGWMGGERERHEGE